MVNEADQHPDLQDDDEVANAPTIDQSTELQTGNNDEDTTPDTTPPIRECRYRNAKKNLLKEFVEDNWEPARKKRRSDRIHKSKLFKDIEPNQWPIVCSKNYNISFWGLEWFHPFDSGKWGKICDNLKKSDMGLKDSSVVEPVMPSEDDLLVVHTEKHLDSLNDSNTVAKITEVWPLYILPNWLLQTKILTPLKHQTGGTILAANLAMERGWAINIGGGFHHCCADMGGGFCAFADISLAVKFLFEKRDDVKKAMIVDLDAHQGNGHERDFLNDDRMYIMDVYNASLPYPSDNPAKAAIKKRVPLHSGTGDEEYLEKVERGLKEALDEFEPDIIVYNAGTDVLEGDPLGKLSVSKEGVIERDEIVFREVKEKEVPIVMVTSGGYQRCTSTADVVSKSIINLHRKGYISAPSKSEKDSSDDEARPSWSCRIS